MAGFSYWFAGIAYKNLSPAEVPRLEDFSDLRGYTQPADEEGIFNQEIGPVLEVGLIGFAEGPSATSDLYLADSYAF